MRKQRMLDTTLAVLVLAGSLGAAPAAAAPLAEAITAEALLDTLQHTAFDFFWNEANPANGLIKDRSTPASACSIASLGFGLTAILIGIDHGWVTRDAGRERIRTALETLWNGPQGSGPGGFIGYQGFFYHFLDMNTAVRTWNCELSSIDTALLFAGILDAKQYFSTGDPLDVEVRGLADSITQRADWNWFRNNLNGVVMGWDPDGGFQGYGLWIGYNEAMILYLLALGSPTHQVPASCWTTWTNGYDWLPQYGYTYVNFPPLFGHQYSHCWVDFRYIRDAYMAGKGITYFENSRRATLAQRAYCIDNPGNFIGYAANLWGITASDGPDGYEAHGAPPAQNDDGTIALTAPAGSIPFAPDESIVVLKHVFETQSYMDLLWGPYGFKDAFNLSRGWWDTDYIGIDQGPVIIMIENYRTGSVWSRMMQNPDIQLGLSRAGFTLAADVRVDAISPQGADLLQSWPNPFTRSSTVAFRLAREGRVTITLVDVAGREVARPADGIYAPGTHAITLDAGGLPGGVYYCRLDTEGARLARRCVLLK